MAKVRKRNRILTINEDKVSEYLELGYSEIDGDGEIIRAGSALTLKDIKEENLDLKIEVMKLKEINKGYEKDLSKLKEDIKKLKSK